MDKELKDFLDKKFIQVDEKIGDLDKIMALQALEWVEKVILK